MATYYSSHLTANGSNTSRPIGGVGHGLGGNLKAFYFEVAFTAAWTSSDTTYLGWLPAGFRYMGAFIAGTDMDSGTTLTWDLGDTGDPDRLVQAAGHTVGQTAQAVYACRAPGSGVGFSHKYSADTLATATPVGSPATTTGSIYVSILGTIEGGAS